MIRNVPFALLGQFNPLENLPNYIINRVAEFPPSKVIAKYPSLKARNAAIYLLTKFIDQDDFFCDDHKNIGTNVFYNRKGKLSQLTRENTKLRR